MPQEYDNDYEEINSVLIFGNKDVNDESKKIENEVKPEKSLFYKITHFIPVTYLIFLLILLFIGCFVFLSMYMIVFH